MRWLRHEAPWYFEAMHALTIPLFDELKLASGRSTEELEGELRLHLATRLYELRRVSIGQAAEMAGLSKTAFIEALGRMQIPVIRWDPSEVEMEFADG